jgi:signal transduction histidine kinase
MHYSIFAKTNRQEGMHLLIIGALIVTISVLHYSTPTSKLPFHLLYMQSYFIPIILGAFWFGVRGGLGSALVVSALYLPHIMFQWGGFNPNNLIRFLQIGLFLALGYLTGLKAQGEKKEKEKYQRAAKRLQRSLEELRKKTEQIFEMEQQLKVADRLAIIGELTANLAHEVRNPLGSIRGAVEIIRDAVPDDVKKLEFFDILIHETQRLNGVVENYLNYAKKKSKMVSLFDLREIVADVVLMLGVKARKSEIKLQVNLDERPLMLKGDSIHIWQILMNVLLNAIQAMPRGGKIWIDAHATDSSIRLVVRDEGEGIPQAKLSRIFDSFYTTKTNGSGLGLAIVKRIAEENKWTIALKSEEGKGTEFVLTLPLSTNSQSVTATHQSFTGN